MNAKQLNRQPAAKITAALQIIAGSEYSASARNKRRYIVKSIGEHGVDQVSATSWHGALTKARRKFCWGVADELKGKFDDRHLHGDFTVVPPAA